MSAPTAPRFDSWNDPLALEPEADPPLAATVLTFVAALLILVEGALVAGAASDLPGEVGGLVGTLGGLGILFGLILMVLAFVLYTRPDHHVVLGVFILVLSFVSLFSGAGFFLGLLLGVIGGILAIIHDPD